MRSRNVDPCAAVMRTTIQSEITSVPPVTAERSPPLSRITGADSPVMAPSLTEATPSITSPSEGMMSPASTSTMSPTLRLVRRHALVLRPVVVGRGAWPASRYASRRSDCRLRLAAALGHRLGEIREQHREPEPQDDLEGETEVLAASREVAQEDHRGQGGDDLDHEHDRILHQGPWIELGKSRADRRNDDLRIGQRGYGHPLAQMEVAIEASPDAVVRTAVPPASRDARRPALARAPGRR